MVSKKIMMIAFIGIILLLTACNKGNMVHFNTNGGSEIHSEKSIVGANYNDSHVPLHAEKVFSGWFLDAELKVKYEPSKHGGNSLSLYAKWEEKNEIVTENDVINLYEYAYQKHLDAIFSETIAEGVVKTTAPIIGDVEQKLYSLKQVKEGIYYQYTASHSTPAQMMFEVYGNKTNIRLRRGDVDSTFNVKKTTHSAETTLEQHKQSYGVLPNELNYIVNKDTVLEVKNYIYKDDIHHFTLILDNEKSVVNYLKNIKATNKYDSEPAVFSKIQLNVKINNNGYFNQITYAEAYDVKVNAPFIGWTKQPMKASITEVFKYENNFKINIKTEEGIK